MSDLIPQREHFDRPERLSPAWMVRKGTKTAECVVWLHQFGFQLRVTIGDELIQSRVAFEQKGWL